VLHKRRKGDANGFVLVRHSSGPGVPTGVRCRLHNAAPTRKLLCLPRGRSAIN
jgi:hypothetical protein